LPENFAGSKFVINSITIALFSYIYTDNRLFLQMIGSDYSTKTVYLCTVKILFSKTVNKIGASDEKDKHT